MFTATKDKILPTTVTGSWPRPDWYDTDSGGERFAICMTESRFRERFKDATSVVISDQEQAGLDILTNGDYHLDPEMAGRSWLHYPLDRIGGLSQDDFTPPTEALYEYPKGTLLNEIMAQGWMWPKVHGKLTMANPKLDGFTKENRPYSMRAARAVQDVSNTSIFELDDIQAKLPLSDENWANVVTAKGIYDKDKNTLTIPTPMTVTTTDGMVAKLNSAFVNIGAGELKTSDPVDITLQGSHITADRMTVEDRGKVLVFDEKVRLTMMPQKKKTAERTNGATDASH